MTSRTPRAVEAGILKTVEQLDAAPGGLYVVRSGTPAYYPTRALIATKEARLRGEFFDDDANHVITVELAQPEKGLNGFRGNLGMSPQQTIRIGAEFFITALKDYDNWPVKWWREAVQNSVDAGASQIDLTVAAQPDGTFVVACDDDGRGMDEDTMINKFLVLGATTKVGEAGKAGGFGKAKELLLLPWISWKLYSRDRLVDGAGIAYRVHEAPMRKGTRLEVVMPADKTTSEAAALAFLQRCHLPQTRFTVNAKPFYADLRGDRMIAQVPDKADIYYIPDDSPDARKNYQMFVRTHGIWMFDQYVEETPGRIIVELTAPSIDILTANRDGFRDWGVRRAIDQLTTKVAKDNISALKSKMGLFKKKYEGTGKFRARRLEGEVLDHIGPQQNKITSSSLGVINAMLTDIGGATEVISGSAPAGIAEALLDQKFLGAAHIEAAIKQLVWQPDFLLVNDIEGWEVPKKFYPETMTPRVFKLAKTWTELVRFVMMQLGSEERFGVGFLFSTSTAAEARTDEEDHWIMLNPFKNFNRRDAIWSPAQDSDLKWLYAAAIHEATHFADGFSSHDESFAAALTKNFARCADGYRKIKQIAGGIRGRGTMEADD